MGSRWIAAMSLGCLAAFAAADEPADRILVGGRILTVDAGDRVAEAIAIRDGRILAVGTTAEIERLAGPATERIDLAGRTATPGLIDAHAHFSQGGLVRTDAPRPRLPAGAEHRGRRRARRASAPRRCSRANGSSAAAGTRASYAERRTWSRPPTSTRRAAAIPPGSCTRPGTTASRTRRRSRSPASRAKRPTRRAAPSTATPAGKPDRRAQGNRDGRWSRGHVPTADAARTARGDSARCRANSTASA